MKNFFNKKESTKKEIMDLFQSYLQKNKKNVDSIDEYDLSIFLLSASKNKNINNLIAMKESGISLEKVQLSKIQDALILAANHSNYKEYFKNIIEMNAIKNKAFYNEKNKYESFCLISYLINKNKKVEAESLIKLGYTNELISSNNIISFHLEYKKFKEAEKLIKENKFTVNGENFFYIIQHVYLETEMEKSDYLSFVKELMKNKNIKKDNILFNALKKSFLTNELIDYSEVKKILSSFSEESKNEFEKYFLYLKETKQIYNLYSSLRNGYPEKMDFLKEQLSETEYNKIMDVFVGYIIENPKDNVVDDLISKTNIIERLSDSVELIKEEMKKGNLEPWKLYTRFNPDNNLLELACDDFMTNNIIANLSRQKSAVDIPFKYYVSMDTMESFLNFVNEKNINEVLISLPTRMNYHNRIPYTMFGIAMDYNNKEIIEKIINVDNFDFVKNIALYITHSLEYKDSEIIDDIKKDLAKKIEILYKIKSFLKIDKSISIIKELDGLCYSPLMKDNVKKIISDLEKIEIQKSLKKGMIKTEVKKRL